MPPTWVWAEARSGIDWLPSMPLRRTKLAPAGGRVPQCEAPVATLSLSLSRSTVICALLARLMESVREKVSGRSDSCTVRGRPHSTVMVCAKTLKGRGSDSYDRPPAS